MFQHRILAVVACAALLGACGSSGGGGTVTQPTTTADATDSASSSGGASSGGTSGAGSDAGSTDDAGSSGGSSSGGSGDACDCKKQNAQCGYLPGCTASCGGCPPGQNCKSNVCVAGNNVKLKKFGEWCGPDKDCRPPVRLQSDDDNQWDTKQQQYQACLNAQCETNLCFRNVCTKECQYTTDDVVNHSGDKGKDGIEDPKVDSACGDAENGPYGDKWRCVELRSEQQVSQSGSFARCYPGETFKPCKANSDCPTGEMCTLAFIYGEYSSRCQPAKKQKDGKPGAGPGERCNDDPFKEEMNACRAHLCFGVGCAEFCKTDDDCNTAPKGACKAGKCGNGKDCKTDTDCSALSCQPRKLFSDSENTFDMCWPKNCELNTDCPDDSFYCRYYYNGVKNPEGDPDPNDKTKVTKPGWDPLCLKKLKGGAKPGEKCDPYTTDDDDKYPKCENDGQCNGGVCGNMCKGDKDCAKDMKCRTVHFGLDLSNPEDNIDDIYLKYENCVPLPGAEGSCLSSKQCKDGKQCKFFSTAIDPATQATPTDYKYTGGGVCTTDDAEQGKAGEICGPESTGKKLCKSGFCLGTSVNWCSELCGKKSDCPDLVTIGQFGQYKMACRSFTMTANNTGDVRDTIYVPLCVPYGEQANPLTDCSATKKCGAQQTCWAFPIATGPDKPVNVEYLCVSNQNQPQQQGQNPPQPTLDPGAECNVEAENQECKSRLCLPGNKAGKGYCSALCNSDADCGTGMFCDKDNMGFLGIARKDASKAGKVPLCRKKLSCTQCAYDWHCPTSFACTNLADAGTLAKQRCAPSCKSDADCAGTDGGSKCVEAVDVAGNKLANKVCKPASCQ